MRTLFGAVLLALCCTAPAVASTCENRLTAIERELKAAESTLSPTRAHGHLSTAEQELAAFAAAGCPQPLLENAVRQFLALPPTTAPCPTVRERVAHYTGLARTWADGNDGFRDRAARTYEKAAGFNARVADNLGCAP